MYGLSQSRSPRAGPWNCANRHLKSADRYSRSAKWSSWALDPRLNFSPFWTPVLRFFEPGLAFRRVFNPYSKIKLLFLDNSGLLSNDILQINTPKSLDYSQFCCYLIILFIPMHVSLFLTKAQSHVMFVLHNMRMVPSNVRKKKRNHQM